MIDIKYPATQTTQQTPIEVALKIDENGMTTAKALYEFLELRPNDYSRWCKDNIANNPMAEIGKDFEVLRIDAENSKNQGLGGRPSKNYRLTATFAKKLAMSTNTPKGDLAKEYFIKIEDKLKGMVQPAAVQLQAPDRLAQFQAMEMLFKNAVEQEKRLMEQEEAITDLQYDVDYIKSNIDNHVVQIVEEMPAVERSNQQIILSEISGVDRIYFTTTDIALAFGMKSAISINKFLTVHGIIKPCSTMEGWTMTERYEVLSLCSYDVMKMKTGDVQYIRWNEQGVKFIVSFLKKKGFEQKRPVRRDPNWRKTGKRK